MSIRRFLATSVLVVAACKGDSERAAPRPVAPGSAAPATAPAPREIEPKELAAQLAAGTITHLYDVRTEDERAIASIEGAKIYSEAAAAAIEALPKDTPIAFHCHHGPRSKRAAKRFTALGFTNVYVLAGGIDSWSLDVDPKLPRY